MNETKIKALIETKTLLANAWGEVYKVSKGELESEYYTLRSNINDLEMFIHEMLEKELNK